MCSLNISTALVKGQNSAKCARYVLSCMIPPPILVCGWSWRPGTARCEAGPTSQGPPRFDAVLVEDFSTT
ncbi:uncharacterized protein RSE6_07814 [Rhynchosporium secalis]|uniref:Uncharacterized protein n=1 Tax=Rhynchosporium secalis TaxID=38038 RepID=A0A1E1MDT5_RHYSE|nr:uncharacterized protein RSE6_07814 [Rhynchosporium secalis]